MKALVFHGVGNVSLDEVDEPVIQHQTDAIIRITASSICGTDLHMVRGTMPGMKPGTILGHEAVGIVEKVGSEVKEFKEGDRVVVCSTIACGQCAYCEAEEFASCDESNPMGPEAGTAFFGGPALSGQFNGLQAEKARIPFADFTLVKLPDSISDDDALLLSDIFPTGFMGAEIADVQDEDIVAVFGCGPVGQMAIASAFLMGAEKVFAIDSLPDRLKMAEKQGAILVNYEKVDPVKFLKEQTGGYGPDSCIDAVGVDAQTPHKGPAKGNSLLGGLQHLIEQKMVAPWTVMFGDQWRQGDAPFQALCWCVEAVRKSGVVSIIGVYPQSSILFPIGMAMQKSLTVRAANCSHRKYIPSLIQLIKDDQFSPSQILTKHEDLKDVVKCYEQFDQRKPGWVKVELKPNQAA
ncbi:MAG: glutathione-dependent formaldehyde dehydrogenase [Candidatus Obscuribacterales bacterium]|nr:glutathione-dependent formaldehyde dehydrogenase [Candidatus Obscuribacterales bacterium]